MAASRPHRTSRFIVFFLSVVFSAIHGTGIPLLEATLKTWYLFQDYPTIMERRPMMKRSLKVQSGKFLFFLFFRRFLRANLDFPNVLC